MSNNIQKGTVLITGGAKRIGRAVALHLTREGYRIALHYHSSKPEAEAVKAEIDENGGSCVLFQCDLSILDYGIALIHEVNRVCGDFQVLINNASIFEKKSFLDTDEAFFNRHFHLNYKVPFFLTQEFAKVRESGQIINLLDTKVFRTLTEYFAYTASKKALHDFTRMAAKALAPKFRVNGVCPGLILPPEGEDQAYMDEMKAQLPMLREGDPECIARAVLYLMENDFITGECIRVDGGEHLKA